MEKRIEELEVDIRIAEAKADLAIKMVTFLCDELGRSGAIHWGADDFKRRFLSDIDYDDPAEEFARLDIEPGPDGADFSEALDMATAHTRAGVRLRKEILARIKHGRGPS